MKQLAACLVVLSMLAATTLACAQGTTGTLVLDMKSATTDTHLSKGVKNRLENAGLEWGVADGEVVFTIVNKRFVNFNLAQFTRFGEMTTVDVPSGEYKITCIGFVNEGGLLNPEKALDRGAYVNADVVTFRIEPGATTTLSVQPVMQKQAGALVNLFMPDLLVSPPGGGEPVRVNVRTESSVPWATYTGPLKLPAAHADIPRNK
jgi:hypothetical protein